MNREIKFRLWAAKKFYYEFYIFKGKPYCWENFEEDIVPWFNKDQIQLYGEPIIQQFTGFKDKNGKEIYEGDIVNFTIFGFAHGQENEDYQNHLVKWDSSQACWGFINSGAEQFWYNITGDKIDINSFEITGNMFENPDLLNGD